MTLNNLAAILDPAAPDTRDFIIQLSPEADEELRLTYGEARARIAGAGARPLEARADSAARPSPSSRPTAPTICVLYMATMAAGLVSVCVNHKLPRETVAHIMKDSAVKFAVADAERAPLVRELVPTLAMASSTRCSIPAPSRRST